MKKRIAMTKRRVKLTRQSGYPSVETSFVSSGQRAERLVAHRQKNDGQERKDEAGRGADVPLPEHDAQVVGVPGEEHLRVVSCVGSAERGWGTRRTLMLHMSFMPSPWSMSPWL